MGTILGCQYYDNYRALVLDNRSILQKFKVALIFSLSLVYVFLHNNFSIHNDTELKHTYYVIFVLLETTL